MEEPGSSFTDQLRSLRSCGQFQNVPNDIRTTFYRTLEAGFMVRHVSSISRIYFCNLKLNNTTCHGEGYVVIGNKMRDYMIEVISRKGERLASYPSEHSYLKDTKYKERYVAFKIKPITDDQMVRSTYHSLLIVILPTETEAERFVRGVVQKFCHGFPVRKDILMEPNKMVDYMGAKFKQLTGDDTQIETVEEIKALEESIGQDPIVMPGTESTSPIQTECFVKSSIKFIEFMEKVDPNSLDEQEYDNGMTDLSSIPYIYMYKEVCGCEANSHDLHALGKRCKALINEWEFSKRLIKLDEQLEEVRSIFKFQAFQLKRIEISEWGEEEDNIMEAALDCMQMIRSALETVKSCNYHKEIVCDRHLELLEMLQEIWMMHGKIEYEKKKADENLLDQCTENIHSLSERCAKITSPLVASVQENNYLIEIRDYIDQLKRSLAEQKFSSSQRKSKEVQALISRIDDLCQLLDQLKSKLPLRDLHRWEVRQKLIKDTFAVYLQSDFKNRRIAGKNAVGASAHVEIAEHEDFGKVAVKWFHGITTEEICSEIRMAKELQAAPSTIRVYGIIKSPHTNSIVGYFMEYIEQSLQDVIMSDRPYTLKQALKWIEEAAFGYSHYHSLKMMYRDVKPKNLLINEDNELFICDFGTVKIVKEEERHTSERGQSNYMAPEVLKGFYDYKCDVFSIAITLYEVVHRRSAYDPVRKDLWDASLVKSICEGKRPKINETLCPTTLKVLIRRGWSNAPKNRPNMKEFANEIHEIGEQLLDIENISLVRDPNPKYTDFENSLSVEL